MPLSEGDTVPNVTFKTRVRTFDMTQSNPYVWKDVTTQDLFSGKRVVLFALPGAFTPTCSSSHLPGYERDYNALRQHVDDVYCLSVNDAFVMRKWGLDLGLVEEHFSNSCPLNPGNFSNVKLIPDGACTFTRGMGMSCTWTSERGFGERSWRYSMVVNDGQIEKLFVENDQVVQNSESDPFEVSDSGTMLNYLQNHS